MQTKKNHLRCPACRAVVINSTSRLEPSWKRNGGFLLREGELTQCQYCLAILECWTNGRSRALRRTSSKRLQQLGEAACGMPRIPSLSALVESVRKTPQKPLRIPPRFVAA
jgi:hypothetical protein